MQRASGVPHALEGAEDSSNASGAWRREVASVCLESRCRHSSCPGKSAKRVFALDDPGIHQSSQEHFRRRWIAGSSPAMTALQRIAFGCLKIESIVALATRTVCSLPPCGGELERGVATSTNLAATPPSLTLPQSQVGPARLAQDKMQPRQARVAGERERGGARTALKQPFFCCERLSPCYKPAATFMMISDELYPESLS